MGVQTAITAKYGQPDSTYEGKWMIMWDILKDFPELKDVMNVAVTPAVPFTRVYINKDFKAKLFLAFQNLRAANCLGEIKSWGGCFERRVTRGSTTPSLHSWAMAADINPKENAIQFHHVLDPLNHTNFSKKFIDIMKAAGLFWGGDYSTRFDPMHFSLYNG